MNRFWLIPLCAAAIYGSFLINSRHSEPPPKSTKAQLPAAPATVETEASIDELNELAELQHLRSELDILNSQIAQRGRINNRRQMQKPKEYSASLSKIGLTPDHWKPAGRSTPIGSIETLLWAGASGDIQAMFNSIAMGEESADLAKRLFERLPADLQSEYNSPQRFIAALAIDDIPLTHVRAVKPKTETSTEIVDGIAITPPIKSGAQSDDSIATQRLVFTSNVEPPQFVQLQLEKQQNDEWKISIPPVAIVKYANQLGISLDPR